MRELDKRNYFMAWQRPCIAIEHDWVYVDHRHTANSAKVMPLKLCAHIQLERKTVKHGQFLQATQRLRPLLSGFLEAAQNWFLLKSWCFINFNTFSYTSMAAGVWKSIAAQAQIHGSTMPSSRSSHASKAISCYYQCRKSCHVPL